MQKILSALIFVILSVFPLAASASIIIKPANNLGTVGYWPMNEGAGTKVGDASGNGNNGSFSGSPTWTSGKLGQGLSFNGSSDYLNTGTNTALSGNMTVCTWAYPTNFSTANERYLIDREDGSLNQQYALYTLTDGSINFGWGASGAHSFNSAAGVLSLNTWAHICAVRSGVAVTIYVNNRPISTSETGNTSVPSITGNTFIGAVVNLCSDCYWQGKIDEMRLYSRALSATEIAAIYNSGAARFGASSVSLTNGSSLQNGLAGLWTFDGSTINWVTGLVTDSSGQGNTASLLNMSTTTAPTAGRLGQGMYLDGNGYISAADSSSLDVGDIFTYAIWVKRARSGINYETMFSKGFHAAVAIFDGSNRIELCGASLSCPLVTTATISDTSWHQYVFTKNGSAASIYIDGVLSTTTSSAAAFSTNVYHQYIGADNGVDGPGSNMLKGSIDDFRVYNRVLSASEIQQLYNLGATKLNTSSATLNDGTTLGSGLVAHWTFDGSSINWRTGLISDLSGSSHTASVIDMSTSSSPTAGKLGQALKFNGNPNDDRVDAGNSSAFELGSTVSVSAWVKPNSLPTSGNIMTILSKTDGVGNENYNLSIDNGAIPTAAEGWLFYTDNCSGTSQRAEYATIPTLGQWVHLVGVFNAPSNTITLYVNGVQQAQNTCGSAPTGTGPLRIGSDPFSTVFDFDGSIDDVRIYNRAITTGEVKQLYQMGR